QQPTIAATLAFTMIVLFLFMDQSSVSMNLEFLSKGEIPEGVRIEDDEGRDLADLRGRYGDEGIVVGTQQTSMHLPEMVIVVLVGCALTSVSFFLGALYVVVASSTNLPLHVVRYIRIRLSEQNR
nr:NS2B protein [Kamiti River virus]